MSILFIEEETQLANKYVKIHTTSHLTREIQVKTEITYLTNIRLIEIFKYGIPNIGKDKKS